MLHCNGTRVAGLTAPGQTVAIVGPTGAGKTTLINLLQRVQDPTEGRILIDGVDTRTVTRASLRRSVATVFQDAALFNRSIEVISASAGPKPPMRTCIARQ